MSGQRAQCRSCQFWEQYKEPQGTMPAWGFCLRYPPVPVFRPDSHSGLTLSSVTPEWPETRENEWCGEFKQEDGKT